ncbi:MAG: hypothetical protein U5K75_05490 [Ahrensia sp.]|nr:hypothetical protein [Ahrensia sp.]
MKVISKLAPALVPEWQRIVGYSLSFWMQLFGLAALIYPELEVRTDGSRQ